MNDKKARALAMATRLEVMASNAEKAGYKDVAKVQRKKAEDIRKANP